MQDVDELRSLVVRIGGRPVEDGWDRLARYCGLGWSAGSNETWAFRYYDSVWSASDNTVKPVDVLATAALHPGLSKSDLTFFHDEQHAISGWLEFLPTDRGLADVDGAVLRHLVDLASWEVPVSMQLLTKVLHRKRPLLIPLIDRHVLDWYRPMTGERSAAKAWSPLLAAMSDDVDFGNAVFLDSMAAGIEERTFARLSTLRIIDVIVWMGAHS